MRTSITELPVTIEADGYTLREIAWGEMHVEIGTFYKDVDVTPYLKGLPDDRDPIPHWGYLLKGRFRAIYQDREEVVNAGDVFYLEPGRTMIFEAGTEYVVFGPEEEIKKLAPIVARNAAAMQQQE
ncbi:MAG: cupin domain-containing protein [Halobacteriota archaeon]